VSGHLLEYRPSDLIGENECHDPLAIASTALFKPRHVSRRIAAQDGWFSVHRAHEGKTVRFVSLETNERFKPRLHYVTIAADDFGEMRLQLELAGVTAAALFPDLDGIARAVTGTHLYPDDELKSRLGSLW
jgi:hypothetical protein